MTYQSFAPQYYCLLDEQPHYLVPNRLLSPQRIETLVVNPNSWFSWHSPAPARLGTAVRAASEFLPAQCMIWVTDAASGGSWPYWVGYEFIRHVAALAPGVPAPRDMPIPLAWVLAKAEILVTSDHNERKQREWKEHSRILKAQFRHGYMQLRNLIPAFHVAALRRYYRHSVRSGALKLGDDQVPRRYACHNETVARFVNSQLASLVTEIVGSPVKPSYAYVAAYQSGSVLERHTDRPQCEYTITICVDATPEPRGRCPWPIDLSTSSGTVRIFQDLGDGLLFRGRKIAHQRERLVAGHSVTSVLLHYVDKRFGGSLD
jgi:hypothetical protein